MNTRKVMVAMSGGVDSSVAAALLVDAGHEVVGVTMRLWGGESDTGCCSVSDVDDARRVAQQLGIDHVVFNFSEEFEAAVVNPYVEAHAQGITPNPCIECNRHLKFDRLLQRAEILGFDAVATGHHARVGVDAHRGPVLWRGVDRAKDQSYVVHMLTRHDLSQVMFPVGHLTKDAVRKIASDRGLRTATKPDSQDVCFISSTGGREAFLGHRIPFRSARVVDTEGQEVGEVDAIELVTLGQRRGLGLPGGGPKRYVVDIDQGTSTVVVGPEADLAADGIRVLAPTIIDESDRDGLEGRRVLVQCSAHGEPRPAVVGLVSDSEMFLQWTAPQTKVAPGQSIVLYQPDDIQVIGGGLAGEQSPVRSSL
jgi:tRNA-specific 2-thiouridylase